MKAALVTSLEGPAAVVVRELPEPQADARLVAVRVTRAGLNHSDILRTQGRYQDKADLPFSPCGEIAGTVQSAPAGSGFIAGQRVMAYIGHGGAREVVMVDPARLVAIPEEIGARITDTTACGIAITYGTALHALRERAALQPGQWMAVLGAGGGAGLAAIEIGKLMGARIIAVTSAEKAGVCTAAGANAIVDRDHPDLKTALREAAGPNGIDVVYDCVGGASAEAALRSLRSGGRFLVVGFASRTVPSLPLNVVLVKRLDILGVNWPAFVDANPAGYRADMALALAAIADGRITPRTAGEWPLTEIGTALALLDRGTVAGKVVINLG
jgi:NADPH2:quinone reductase